MRARGAASSLEGQLPAGLDPHWDFVASGTPWLTLRRWARLHRRRRAPGHATLAAVSPRERWALYFVFLPEGQLAAHHRFSLQRLREDGFGVLAICATPSPEHVPAELRRRSDALIWKELSGYDFSAYGIGLRALALGSPGAEVLVLNDSVFGPLTSVTDTLRATSWDLTGFTASSLVENHLQSYAFALRSLDGQVLAALAPVLPERWCYRRPGDVILCQELPLGRVASTSLRVGALWYGRRGEVDDPMLERGIELVRCGFPFLKRSLVGKHSQFGDDDSVRSALAAHGHPPP